MTADHLPHLDSLTTEAVGDADLMLDELSVEQLVSLMNDKDATVADAVRQALPAVAAAITAAADRVRLGGRLIYVGAGTSGRLGILDASEIPPTFGTTADVVVGVIAGGPPAIVTAVEAVEDDAAVGAADLDRHHITAEDAVVGIASSGRTPYVLGALRHARDVGALTVSISCNTGAPVSAIADHGIEIPVGPEILAGSTRLAAGTATKMVLNMFSTISMIRLGKTYRTLMVDVRATNAKLRHRAIRIVALATGADESEARRVLEVADWHAKLAIAMIATGRDPQDAQRALDEADGHLRIVIDIARAADDQAPPPTDEQAQPTADQARPTDEQEQR